jgi:hypothetical protein
LNLLLICSLDVGDWTVEQIVDYLINNPLITSLNLASTDFKGKSNELTMIFNAISNRPITKLDFGGCKLGNEEMKAIAKGITPFTSLTYLRLWCMIHMIEWYMF